MHSALSHNAKIGATRLDQNTVSHAGQERKHLDFHCPILADSNRRVCCCPNLDSRLGALEASDIQDIISGRGQSDYSERQKLALTPNPASNPLLELSHPAYGLLHQLVANLASLGIKAIYPWQSDCLLRSGALSGARNLVYSAPTGGGKSLVADVLMLKKVIQNPGMKAMLVLPYVALVQEKLRWLRRAVEGINKTQAVSSGQDVLKTWRKRGDQESVRVVGFFGGSKIKLLGQMWILQCVRLKKYPVALGRR